MKCESLLALLLLAFSPFSTACEKVPESNSLVNRNEVDFCSLFDSPEKYESEIIQTKAIVLGYHTFIFYSDRCLKRENVIALEMDYLTRRKLIEVTNINKINYKTSFLNNNLYGEITVLGELKENDEKQEQSVFHPKYKFFVSEIKKVNILSEEIFPDENARGLKSIK